MKYVPDTTGRLRRRPHFEPRELDRDCEWIVSEFMKAKFGRVHFPISTDALELLVEQHVQDLDLYADLEHLGRDVEGVTHFIPGEKPRVQISRDLSEDLRYENRLRTTLTHEFGHAVYHASLWNVDGKTGDMFKESPPATSIVCKRENIVGAPQADWMEWQAGYVCGAVLMPYSQVGAICREILGQELERGGVSVASTHSDGLVAGVAERFQVSREASRVRLIKLAVLVEPSGRTDLFTAI